MRTNKIEAHRITKPIQLLAAWLISLSLIGGMFLWAGIQIVDRWEGTMLLIAAVCYVPLFIAALFLLQTRFRPELQDDPHYSDYINKKNQKVSIPTEINAPLHSVSGQTNLSFEARAEGAVEPSTQPLSTSEQSSVDWSPWRIAINEHHPQFANILTSLRAAGIAVEEIFGNFANGQKPPDKWLISINEKMPIENCFALLKALNPFDFEGFNFWEPVREAYEDADVYIGAYHVSKFVRITPDLIEILNGPVDKIKFDYYVGRHTQHKKRAIEIPDRAPKTM